MDPLTPASITRHVTRTRSRRQLLGATGRTVLGGMGVALIGRGFAGDLTASLAPAVSAQGISVSIVDFDYEPKTIEVPVGAEVTWTNDGDAPHTATSFDGSTFNSPQLETGDTFSHTFTTAGTFEYFCTVHGPSMSGTVKVVAATPVPTRPYIRPNVHSLEPDGPELTAYATAVAKMKALPDTDPTSWLYQAFIHRVPNDILNAKITESGITTLEELVVFLGDRGWFTCEHHTPFFWSWHRSYLYWFERIVRELGEYPDFALPYWDYSNPAQRTLPEPFRDPASPLFVERRDPSLNGGTMPTLDAVEQNAIFDNICAGWGQTDFLLAQDGMETTPHDFVHGWIGGDFNDPPQPGLMSSPQTSAQDPIFFLHHANMDRLWSSWLAIPGHMNLMDAAWLDNEVSSTPGITGAVIPYRFFDENGAPVTTKRTAREVLDSVADLGYEYEALFTGADAMCIAVAVATPGLESADMATPSATPVAPIELGSNEPDEGIVIGREAVTVPVEIAAPEEAVSALDRGDQVLLTLEGIRGGDVFGVVFEVYVNLPTTETPDFRSPYFAGNFSLFARQPSDEITLFGETMAHHMSSQQFDISPIVADLQERGEWTGDAAVTIVPHTAAETAEATPEAAAAPLVTIAGISIDAG